MSTLRPGDVDLRRVARERALELLYEAEIKGVEVDTLLAGLPLAPAPLAVELVRGVAARRVDIDELLSQRVAPRWSLDRLATVDRAILRLATYELLDVPQRSEAVILNEAVVLARRFGTDDSPRFVNGVLSAVAADVRDISPPSEPAADRLVDALIIDLDGVIRHWDEDELARGDSALGLPAGTIARAAFEPELLDRSMRGEITIDEWHAEVGEAVARQHEVATDAVVRVISEVGWRIDESVMGLVDQVRGGRAPVVLLSNASSRLADDLRLSGIYDRFDKVVGSAELGMTKPDRRIYVAAAEAAGIAPDRCLMVDDRAENVAGAEAAGMHATLFGGVDTLAEELQRVGLLPPPSELEWPSDAPTAPPPSRG